MWDGGGSRESRQAQGPPTLSTLPDPFPREDGPLQGPFLPETLHGCLTGTELRPTPSVCIPSPSQASPRLPHRLISCQSLPEPSAPAKWICCSAASSSGSPCPHVFVHTISSPWNVLPPQAPPPLHLLSRPARTHSHSDALAFCCFPDPQLEQPSFLVACGVSPAKLSCDSTPVLMLAALNKGLGDKT